MSENIIFFIALNVAMFMHSCKVQGKCQSFVQRPKASYDYIVVGAGSAGAVVANRLSEDYDVTVLLIEAGGDDRAVPEIAIPGLTMTLESVPNLVKTYVTKTKGKKSISQEQNIWLEGRVLGGTSSINYLNYVRGAPLDYDRWAEYTGDTTWDYQHVLPYFKRSEKMLDPVLSKSSYHNPNGLLGVTKSEASYLLSKKAIEGFQEMGLPFNTDFNGQSMEGVALTQLSVDNGTRASTAKAFLHPILDRPNLDIMINANVQRVIINKKKAESVEIIFKGRKLVVKSKQEIILSAGTIKSPQILMLSGIGPKEHLRELGIRVVSDLPVGEFLQDHAYTALSFTSNEGALPLKAPITSLGIEVTAFTSVSERMRKLDWPELKLYIAPVCLTSIGTANCWSCMSFPTRPKSIGYLKLNSSDPNDDPILVPNYLQDEKDVKLNYEGLRICQKLSQTKALKPLNPVYLKDTPEVCNDLEFDSKEYWMCYIKTRPHTVYHQSLTCKMGSSNDPTAVVDSRLRVKGVRGLRVADASVMPYLTTGNINAPVIMIGEKAADFIKADRMKQMLKLNI